MTDINLHIYLQINRNYELPNKKYNSDVDYEFKNSVSDRLYAFFSEPENEEEEEFMVGELNDFIQNLKAYQKNFGQQPRFISKFF